MADLFHGHNFLTVIIFTKVVSVTAFGQCSRLGDPPNLQPGLGGRDVEGAWEGSLFHLEGIAR